MAISGIAVEAVRRRAAQKQRVKPSGPAAKTGRTKMTQFHEGQEVEVWKEVRARGTDLHQNYVRRWCKAKIVSAMVHKDDPENDRCEVQFHDSTRAVFDAAHIMAVTTARMDAANDFLKHATLRKGERKRLERIARGVSP